MYKILYISQQYVKFDKYYSVRRKKCKIAKRNNDHLKKLNEM